MSEFIENSIVSGNGMTNSMINKANPVAAINPIAAANNAPANLTAAPDLNNSDHLFVANLQAVSLERLVKSKLEVLFDQQKEAQVELNGLYNIVLEQVEKPLLELALKAFNGNQVKTAQMLGINRNTLKKKMDNYKIRVKKLNS